MKKNRIIQFFLIIAVIILFFFTYYSKDKDEIAIVDKNILNEKVSKITDETSNILQNINY